MANGLLVATPPNFEPLLLRAVDEASEKDLRQVEQVEQVEPRDKLPPAAFTAVVRSIAGIFP